MGGKGVESDIKKKERKLTYSPSGFNETNTLILEAIKEGSRCDARTLTDTQTGLFYIEVVFKDQFLELTRQDYIKFILTELMNRLLVSKKFDLDENYNKVVKHINEYSRGGRSRPQGATGTRREFS